MIIAFPIYFFKTWCLWMGPLQLHLPGGGEGLQNESIFSAVHEILTLKTSAPFRGLIFYWFSGQFMTFPGLLKFWPPKIPPGKLFWSEWFPDQSAYACQIWLQSDGRVEKRGVQTDRRMHARTHTKGHCHISVAFFYPSSLFKAIKLPFVCKIKIQKSIFFYKHGHLHT